MVDVGGRPTKYKPEYDKLAYDYSLLGATDVIMAGYFDVCESTFNNWKIEHPSFLESLKKGKAEADVVIAKSLYKRAQGFQYDEITSENGVETKRVTKMVTADPTSMIFWLKNRQPAAWRDKQEVQVDAHNVNENITTIADMIMKPVPNREIPCEDE
jgi:hypothetical protein